jgi:hypothetical protein
MTATTKVFARRTLKKIHNPIVAFVCLFSVIVVTIAGILFTTLGAPTSVNANSGRDDRGGILRPQARLIVRANDSNLATEMNQAAKRSTVSLHDVSLNTNSNIEATLCYPVSEGIAWQPGIYSYVELRGKKLPLVSRVLLHYRHENGVQDDVLALDAIERCDRVEFADFWELNITKLDKLKVKITRILPDLPEGYEFCGEMQKRIAAKRKDIEMSCDKGAPVVSKRPDKMSDNELGDLLEANIDVRVFEGPFEFDESIK